MKQFDISEFPGMIAKGDNGEVSVRQGDAEPFLTMKADEVGPFCRLLNAAARAARKADPNKITTLAARKERSDKGSKKNGEAAKPDAK